MAFRLREETRLEVIAEAQRRGGSPSALINAAVEQLLASGHEHTKDDPIIASLKLALAEARKALADGRLTAMERAGIQRNVARAENLMWNGEGA